MYLVTSMTNWATDHDLKDALHVPYINRTSETSSLLVVNNDIVVSYGQCSIEVKDEFKDKYFALELVVKEKKVPEYLKTTFGELINKLSQQGFENYAWTLSDINQQFIEVYAVSYNEKKLLTSFEATCNDIDEIVFSLEACDKAFEILSLTSQHQQQSAG